jgi:uncharacterized membrane-anchored protein
VRALIVENRFVPSVCGTRSLPTHSDPRRLVDHVVSKVPELTLGFWIIKIAATTLGETGGDWVTMSLNLGYLIGSLIFLAGFVMLVSAQIRARRFYPPLYWATIVATTTLGTTLADFCDRSLGVGYRRSATGSLATIAAASGLVTTCYRTPPCLR